METNSHRQHGRLPPGANIVNCGRGKGRVEQGGSRRSAVRSQFGNHLRASARCVLVAWAIRNLADGARTEQSLTQRGLVIRPKTPRRLPQSCVGVFAQDRDGEMPTNRLSDSTRPLFATNARHAGVSCAFCFKGTVLIRSSAFWPQFAARRLYEVY